MSTEILEKIRAVTVMSHASAEAAQRRDWPGAERALLATIDTINRALRELNSIRSDNDEKAGNHRC
jgi:hypothetical protein